MSYIYRMENGKKLIPNEENFNLNYISLKKKSTTVVGDPVAIYCKNEYGEGIFALGNIIGKKYSKSSKTDPEKSITFLNRNYFQKEIELHSLSRTPIIPIEVLKQFPSYNNQNFNKPFNPYVLYWSANFHWEYSYLSTRFQYDFGLSNLLGYFSERHWKFFLHILREQNARFHWHRILPQKNPKCEKCGFFSEKNYLLEIHDTSDILLEVDYKPVKISDFIVLCPTCHKEEHLEIRED